ncbi:MAG: hypothetical protein RID91_03620 [Azospirillaceae bacterium]
MFRSTAKAVGALLLRFGIDSEPPRPPAPARPADSAPTPAAFDHKARARLEDRAGDQVAAGTLQVLGLDAVREALGRQWSDVADQVDSVAESVLHRHLGSEDFYSRPDPENYVICFSRLGRTAAERTTRKIGEEIRVRLLEAAPEYAALRVDHTVSEVDVDLILEDDDGPLAAIGRQLSAIRDEAQTAMQQARALLKNSAEVKLRPVWTCRSGMVEGYVARLDDFSGANLLSHIQLVSDPSALVDLTAEMDGVVLGRAVAMLHDALKDGRHGMIVVPVNYNTLNGQNTRNAFLALCQRIPEGYRKFIALEIYGVPDKCPDSRLLELIQSVRPFGRGVLVEIKCGTDQCASLLDKGIMGVAVDLGHVSKGQTDNVATVARAARTAGLKAFGHRANTRGVGLAAFKAGFHFLDGEAIAPSLSVLKDRHKMRSPFDSYDTAESKYVRSSSG